MANSLKDVSSILNDCITELQSGSHLDVTESLTTAFMLLAEIRGVPGRPIRRIGVREIDVEELSNQIYDTLIGCVGFSPEHRPFMRENVLEQEVSGKDGKIYLRFVHKCFEIQIKEVKRRY